ncbi:hypothetical protein [Streptomyces mirabilis]|uniref:hypothetical protein n=1 Tax=Streptomyces mirabilis TaxID=68239 RepID=UPI0036CD0BB2
MRARTAAAIAVLLLAPLTACSSGGDKADPAACKAAMAKQFKDAAKGSAAENERPAACNGVDDKTVQKYVGEIMESEIGKQVGDSLSSATAQP